MIITGWDVQNAKHSGKNQILIDDDTIVTDIAKDLADMLGVTIVDSSLNIKADITKKDLFQSNNKLRIDDNDAKKLKKEFPILENTIHVGNCSQSPQCNKVRKTIEDYLDDWSMNGMSWDCWIEETMKAKKEFAKLINADADEVAISTSVSQATSSIASALEPHLNKRKIVTTEAEFPTIGYVWLAQRKHGFDVEFVPIKEGKIDMNSYDKYIDQNTLLTSITHVCYQNGFKQDIEKICELAHHRGSLAYVDAYQSLGTVMVDVKRMKIDMLSSGNLKYLLGAPGIAFLYISKEILPYLKPTVTGWFGQENPFSFKINDLDYAKDARRFETGTPPILASYAARAGMEIINELGVENIQERVEALSDYTIKGALLRGLQVTSPLNPKQKGAITSLKVDDAPKVEKSLKENNIIASARGDVIRIAPHFFTEKNDIDIVMENLKNI